MVEQEEESGWTSYLDTACPSLSLLSDSAFDPHSMSLSTAHHADQVAHSFQNTSFNRHLEHKLAAAAQKGNSDNEDDYQQPAGCKSGGRREDFPGEESCGSSTLSDANSSLGAQPDIKHAKSSRNHQRSKRKRHTNCMVLKDPLEDTATSSPSSNQISKYRRISSYSVKYGEHDVSKRFKALGALIPCLKEMVGKANEEEMLSAVISHVRALEQKVQLLSDVWRLSQVKHVDKSL